MMRWRQHNRRQRSHRSHRCFGILLILTTTPLFAGWEEGLAAFKRGDYAVALAEIETVVEGNPDYAPGHYMLGSALFELKRFDEAIKGLETAVGLDGENPQYVLTLARAQIAGDRNGEAFSTLEDRPVADLPEKLRLPYAQLLATAASHEPPHSARPVLERVVEEVPDCRALWIALARMRKAAGEPEEGFHALARAYSLAPRDLRLGRHTVRQALALAQDTEDETERRRWYGEASRVAETLSQADPSLDTGLLLGEARLGAQDYSGAHSWFAQLAESHPDEVLLPYYMGRASTALDEDERAVAELQTALQRVEDPEVETRIYDALGHAYHKLRRYDLAAGAYHQAHNEVQAQEMEAAVDAERVNQELDQRRDECRQREKRWARFREENALLEGLPAWKEMEARIRAAMADCQPYL